MDLGILPKDLNETSPAGPDAKKKSYPSFTVNDDQVDKVKGDETCSVGDEYTATVRLRVSRLSDDTYGKSLGFDVISLDDFAPAEGESDDSETPVTDNPDTEVDEANPAPSSTLDDAAEENILGYKRTKKNTPVSAGKSLQD